MTFTYDIAAAPTTDLDKLRVAIGDMELDNGPAPDRANLSDELLGYFLDTGGGLEGAAAMAFDHLAALWLSRPVFGPGELSTIHVDMYRKFKAAADDWRKRSGDADAGGAVVTVGSFSRVDGYTDSGSEYT